MCCPRHHPISENYVFSGALQAVGWLLFAICIAGGVGVGIVVSPFWGFTTSWFAIVGALFVWAYGLSRAGAISASGAVNPTPLLFTDSGARDGVSDHK